MARRSRGHRSAGGSVARQPPRLGVLTVVLQLVHSQSVKATEHAQQLAVLCDEQLADLFVEQSMAGFGDGRAGADGHDVGGGESMSRWLILGRPGG